MTLVTAEHVAADIGGDAWPPVVSRDQLEGGVFPRVSSSWGIMTLSNHCPPKIDIWWNISMTLVIDNTIFFLPLW